MSHEMRTWYQLGSLILLGVLLGAGPVACAGIDFMGFPTKGLADDDDDDAGDGGPGLVTDDDTGPDCEDHEILCDGACVDPSTDVDHCGTCGESCGWEEECCDGECADLDEDPDHCGDCGVECDGGESCLDGSCCVVDCLCDCHCNCAGCSFDVESTYSEDTCSGHTCASTCDSVCPTAGCGSAISSSGTCWEDC